MKKSDENALQEIRSSLRKIQENSNTKAIITVAVTVFVISVTIILLVIKLKKHSPFISDDCPDDFDDYDDFDDDDDDIVDDYYAIDYEEE